LATEGRLGGIGSCVGIAGILAYSVTAGPDNSIGLGGVGAENSRKKDRSISGLAKEKRRSFEQLSRLAQLRFAAPERFFASTMGLAQYRQIKP
jgi:hypothetical protein